MYRLFSKIYPKNLKKKYAKLLEYANLKINSDRFLGFLLSFGILLGFALGLNFHFLFKINLWYAWIGIFVLFEGLVYFWLLMSVDKRAKFIENVLPDALQLMASNLRAGLTVDKALLLSVRPEFGPLQEEINIVGKGVTTGEEIGKALMNMSKRIRSEKVEKSILLIVSGLKAGGALASLLEQTARNLRDQRVVEEKIRSNVLMYVIFIFVAIGVGAPLLFGLSSLLVEVISDLMSNVQLPESQVALMTLPIKFTTVPLSSSYVIKYALISLITSSVMGSFIIGLIAKGKEREGAKYIPLLILLSVAIFFIVRFIVGTILGGLFEF